MVITHEAFTAQKAGDAEQFNILRYLSVSLKLPKNERFNTKRT